MGFFYRVLFCLVAFAMSASAMAQPSTSTPPLPSARDVSTFCAAIPVTVAVPTGVANTGYLRATAEAGDARANSDLMTSVAWFWEAFMRFPTPENLSPLVIDLGILVQADQTLRPQYCAVLACLGPRLTAAQRLQFAQRQTQARCAELSPTNVVTPVGPNPPAAVEYFTLTGEELRLVRADERVAQIRSDPHTLITTLSGTGDRWEVPATLRPLVTRILTDARANAARRILTPAIQTPRRSTAAWAGSIAGWSVGLTGFVTYAVAGLACNSANDTLEGNLAGRILNWDREAYAAAQNMCPLATAGLITGIVGAVAGTTVFFLTTPRATVAPNLGRDHAGLTLRLTF